MTKPNSIDYSHDGQRIKVEWENDPGTWENDPEKWKINYPPNTQYTKPPLTAKEISEALHIASKLSSLTDAFNQAFSHMDNQRKSNLGFTLMRQVALMGHERAQNEVGCMYKDGTHGAPKSHKQAIKFFKMAEKQGSPYATERLKEIARSKKNG